MDPVTQGVLGALAAQSKSSKVQLGKAALIGALAGMAADLDALIRSSTDPLLSLQYHRHFTHSLAFIPIGGLICALILYPLLAKRWQLSFKQTLLWCCLGYATHALLDSCTSYGTQLFWPFSNYRVAWDVISIIDPLFTLPLLSLLLFSAWRKSRFAFYTAICWLSIYLSLGFIQHERAINMGKQIAQTRGHTIERIDAKPSFGNLVVWKTIYLSDHYFYVDAVKVGINNSFAWHGDKAKKLNLQEDLPWLNTTSQQATDIERFRQFSTDFLSLDRNDPNRVVDIRYSMLPHKIDPLWGIILDPKATDKLHVRWFNSRENGKNSFAELWSMINQTD